MLLLEGKLCPLYAKKKKRRFKITSDIIRKLRLLVSYPEADLTSVAWERERHRGREKERKRKRETEKEKEREKYSIILVTLEMEGTIRNIRSSHLLCEITFLNYLSVLLLKMD